MGADIGGFQGHATAELFLRWMQYGTLTPFCRNHSEIGNVDQYAWAFGPVVEALVRDAIRLRYRLMPYLYAAFWHASQTGEPVQRPLVLDHQYDPSVRILDDEYLLGTDLLVAPVTAPGSTHRQVYLPAGEWYDWHSDQHVGGQRFLLVPTPMERIPLFVRAGAVVPMWPEAPASTDGYFPEVVELHLFVPVDEVPASSVLVEDDGLTRAAQDGAHHRTTFAVRRRGSEVSVVATVSGAGYPEHRRRGFRLVVHGATPSVVTVNGEAVRAEDGGFPLADEATGFTARFDV